MGCAQAAPVLETWWNDIYKEGATGDGAKYAGRSYWISTYDWSNAIPTPIPVTYPFDESLYSIAFSTGFSTGLVPTFAIIGFNGTNKIVYWDSIDYNFTEALNQAINEFPLEGVYVNEPIPVKAYNLGISDVLDISNVFDEYDLNPITVTLEGNTDTSAITATLVGTTLTLDAIGHSDTFTTITLKGESSVNSKSTTFDVYTHEATSFERLDQDFEVDMFPPPFWDLKYNTAADGGLNGANLLDPPTNDTWFKNTPSTPDFGSNYIQSGNYSAAIMYWAPEFNWLITPAMQLDYDDYLLDFYIWFDNEYASKFNVMIDDGTKGWTSILALDSADSNHFDSKISLDLNPFVGQTIKIAFVYEYSDGMEVAIDSVSVWSSTVGIQDLPMPSSTKLEQNYPNPFNPSTEISFTLDHDAHAKLTVFNPKGEIVNTLNNSKVGKGSHSFVFDAKDLNSGVYFYQLEVNGVKSAKKMILMK